MTCDRIWDGLTKPCSQSKERPGSRTSQWETEVFSPNCIRAAPALGCTHWETSKLTRQLKGTDGGQRFSSSVTLEAAQSKVMVPKQVLSVQHLVLIRDDDGNDYEYSPDKIIPQDVSN